MDNKAPILISYLAQIVLLIVLLQVTGLLKAFTLGILLITNILIITSISGEKKWDFSSWYAFFIFLLISAYLLVIIFIGVKDTTIVTIMLGVIMGFFLTVVPEAKKRKEEPKKIDIVDLEKPEKPEMVEIKTESTDKNRKKKRKTKRAFIVSKKNGKVYHHPTCWTLKNTPKKDIIIFTSERQAKNKNLKKCKICMRE